MAEGWPRGGAGGGSWGGGGGGMLGTNMGRRRIGAEGKSDHLRIEWAVEGPGGEGGGSWGWDGSCWRHGLAILRLPA